MSNPKNEFGISKQKLFKRILETKNPLGRKILDKILSEKMKRESEDSDTEDDQGHGND